MYISIKQYLGQAAFAEILTFEFGESLEAIKPLLSFLIFLLFTAASSLAMPRTLKQSPLFGVKSRSNKTSDLFLSFSIESTSNPSLVNSDSSFEVSIFIGTFSKR